MNETIAAGEGDFSALTSKQYDGGHILSMYLIDEYGEDAVWDLLRNDASSWSDAVEEELGVTQAELERNWYRWAEENIGGDYSDQIDSQEPEAELEEKEKKINELEAELEEKEKKIKQLKTGFTAAIAAFAGIFIALYFMS